MPNSPWIAPVIAALPVAAGAFLTRRQARADY